MLSFTGRTCPPEQINLVATLFEKHSNGVPTLQQYETVDGKGSKHVSFGFYHLFMKLTKYEADPTTFFQLLEIDRKIGWTNPAHVEEIVFANKGIKIIEDEKVRDRISFTLHTDPHFYFRRIIIFSELVKMVSLSRYELVPFR